MGERKMMLRNDWADWVVCLRTYHIALVMVYPSISFLQWILSYSENLSDQ